MTRRITIDPITRLEGHGRINIFLDDCGHVDKVYLQVPDFKGFEKFCEGRAVEEMPTLTQKICGVCPMAHHIASSKALDDLFIVHPPTGATRLRELMYSAFIFEDHLLHFFFLGGPDLFVGANTPTDQRNIFGVIRKIGETIGRKMIDIRNRVRGITAMIAGSAVYPVSGLPGGVSKTITHEQQKEVKAVAADALAFACETMKLFDRVVLGNRVFRNWLNSDIFSSKTYYMGIVDSEGKVNFYDGKIRIIDPSGNEFTSFYAKDYLNHLEERIETWSYQKVLYLKKVGWRGYSDGKENGIYRVGPLARLNVSTGMATPLAHAQYVRMYDALGTRPLHNILAYHWARLIEVIYAAERMLELANDDDLPTSKIRTLPSHIQSEGIGVCEAPRGTLFHHYTATKAGIIGKVNLLVATQNNAAAICMSIEKAARAIFQSDSNENLDSNIVEMAFRAYDPCLACATH